MLRIAWIPCPCSEAAVLQQWTSKFLICGVVSIGNSWRPRCINRGKLAGCIHVNTGLSQRVLMFSIDLKVVLIGFCTSKHMATELGFETVIRCSRSKEMCVCCACGFPCTRPSCKLRFTATCWLKALLIVHSAREKIGLAAYCSPYTYRQSRTRSFEFYSTPSGIRFSS